jgi:ATP-dependent Lon protease
MGTGKTTLIKHGISKILNRPFAFITLGGSSDGAFLEGHSYTYEGSTYGKIVDILIQSKVSNPVIFFDELDKVSQSDKGDEIIGILTHLIDSTQNTQFHDKYFSELDFDVSKCLFVFSYNDEEQVNPILKDRMTVIDIPGYGNSDKISIARDYLIPEMNREYSLLIEWTDSLIELLIEKTEKESGVRNLKRSLDTVYSKLNLVRILKPDMRCKVTEDMLHEWFPFHPTTYSSMYL